MFWTQEISFFLHLPYIIFFKYESQVVSRLCLAQWILAPKFLIKFKDLVLVFLIASRDVSSVQMMNLYLLFMGKIYRLPIATCRSWSSARNVTRSMSTNKYFNIILSPCKRTPPPSPLVWTMKTRKITRILS